MMSSAAHASEAAVEQPQLAVSGVSKRFGGVRAVEDVTVSVGQGEIVSIIGPNGAGKTTLLNIVSGLFQPNSGSILLEGRDITGERPSRIAAMGVARTFQNIALFNGMSVLDNIMLGRHVRMRSGTRPARSPTACANAWSLHARSRSSRRSCCSTSPWAA